MMEQYLLSILIFLPFLSSLFVFCIKNKWTARLIGFLGSILTMLVSWHMWFYFDGSSHQIQFFEQYHWMPKLGIDYVLGVDGLSLLLVVLSCFLTPLILLSVWHSDKKITGLLLFLESTMLGSLLSLDLVFFYIYWEAMLIPMYFLIGIWGGKDRIFATTKFMIYTIFGSILMLIAVIGLYYYHREFFGEFSTNILDLYRLSEKSDFPQGLFFLAFAIAFAIKVPLWPFHSWLPFAHTEAPTAGSVVLAGVLLKMGTYGFLRFAIPLFPDAVLFFGPMLLSLGVCGIIYGALVAWMQEDAKKLVAYSSVSHLGFIVVGSFSVLADGTLSEEALSGALYQMIHHGISTGALFFLVGILYERRHTRYLSDFGGLAKVLPWFAVCLVIATMGAVGLPGTGGFVGEFLILLGAFQAKPVIAVISSFGVLLGAIYMLKFCREILFGDIKQEENKTLSDLSFRESAYLAPLCLLIVIMGIFPNFFLSKTKESIKFLSKNYQSYHLTAMEKN